MQYSNFKILDQIALITDDGYYLDLHSNFEFNRIECDIGQSELILSWKRAQKPWASKEKINSFTLLFSGVSMLYMLPRDPAIPNSEDSSISFMGYLHPEDINVMDGCLPEELAKNDYHIIFGFQGGVRVKIAALQAILNCKYIAE